MSRIHFIGGEKGGVGKSMTARLLAQYYIDNELSFLGFDSDQSHGTFSRFYNEFASPVFLNEDDSLDSILEAVETAPTSDIIVDLAAQTSKRLGEWIEEADVLGLLDELGHEVHLWHVMDDGADAVGLLEQSLVRYSQPEVQFVVVMNLGRGENFSKFKETSAFENAKNRDAFFFELAKLQTKLTQKIDFNNLSFWAAANNRSDMGIAERQRAKVWLKRNYDQLDQLLKP